jgi:hypothetical protein
MRSRMSRRRDHRFDGEQLTTGARCEGQRAGGIGIPVDDSPGFHSFIRRWWTAACLNPDYCPVREVVVIPNRHLRLTALDSRGSTTSGTSGPRPRTGFPPVSSSSPAPRPSV